MAAILLDWHVRNCVVFGINCFVSYGFGATNRVAKLFNLPLKSNKEVADKYPTLITPASASFSIWSVIFGMETAFVIWQCTEDYHWLLRTSRPFFFANIFQSIWTLFFASEKIAHSTCILGPVTGAVYCSFLLSYHEAKPLQSMEYLVGCLPFGIHATWVAVATLVSMNMTLVRHDVDIEKQVKAAWISTTVAMCLGAIITWWTNDAVFAFGMAYGLAGISAGKVPASLTKKVGEDTVKNLKRYAMFASAATFVFGLFYFRTN